MYKILIYWKNEKINSWYLKYLKDKVKCILNILCENDLNEYNFILNNFIKVNS